MKSIYILLILPLSLCCANFVHSGDERSTIYGNIPFVSESTGKKYERMFEKLIVALNETIPELNIVVTTNHIRRINRDIALEQSDFLLPCPCEDPSHIVEHTRLGSVRIGTTPFGLFSRKSKPVTLSDLLSASYQLNEQSMAKLKHVFTELELFKLRPLKDEFADAPLFLDAVVEVLGRDLNSIEKGKLLRSAFPYNVEATTSNQFYSRFGTPAYPSLSAENSIRKLIRGRIDAYIYPAVIAENEIEMQDASDMIFRDFYGIVDQCFMVTDSEKGMFVDKVLSEAILKLRENGTYSRLFGEYDQQEREWVERYRVSP